MLGCVKTAVAQGLKGPAEQRANGGADDAVLAAAPGGRRQLCGAFQAGGRRLLPSNLFAEHQRRRLLLQVQHPHGPAHSEIVKLFLVANSLRMSAFAKNVCSQNKSSM